MRSVEAAALGVAILLIVNVESMLKSADGANDICRRCHRIIAVQAAVVVVVVRKRKFNSRRFSVSYSQAKIIHVVPSDFLHRYCCFGLRI